MRSILPEDFPGIIQSIREGVEEIAGAFLRGVDVEVRIKEADLKVLENGELPGITGAGLEVFLGTGDGEQGAVLLAPLPKEVQSSWLESPDATGESRLATLAQELSVLLLPADCAGEMAETRFHADLAAASSRFSVGETTQILEIPCEVISGEKSIAVCCYLIGPVTSKAVEAEGRSAENAASDAVTGKPRAETPSAAPTGDPAPQAPERIERRPATQVHGPNRGRVEPRSVRDLPLITRSLLRIRVPVQVTLAETRRPLSEVLQFAPGVIIQFNKSCEEPLELQINGRTVAVGEAVKVGDKFGLRITKMTPPPERYVRLAPTAKAKPLQAQSS